MLNCDVTIGYKNTSKSADDKADQLCYEWQLGERDRQLKYLVDFTPVIPAINYKVK